jgi:hypothetical protein
MYARKKGGKILLIKNLPQNETVKIAMLYGSIYIAFYSNDIKQQ